MSKYVSVGACVADTNARGQLLLILGTMHNFEEYAIVIPKMMVPFLKSTLIQFCRDSIVNVKCQIVRWIPFL